jgi:chromosome partitioning protein
MAARIITVFNQKGGCGKTTSSMHVAGTLGLRGFRSMLVDMDEQGTATRWASQAPEEAPFPASVIGLAPSGGAMHREVRKFVNDYDFIVIDCPPAVHSPAPSSALLISDLAIIPVVPSPPDLWAAVAAKTLAQHAQVQNETLQIRVLANMVQRRVSLAKQAIEILGDDEDFKLMNSMIGSRSAFRECQAMGCTVHGVSGAKDAAQEVDAMVDEVLNILGMKEARHGN